MSQDQPNPLLFSQDPLVEPDSDGRTALQTSTRGPLQDMSPWLRLLIVLSTCLVVLLAIGVAVRLIAAIHHTVLLFALGGLLAYAFDPLVEWVRAIRGSRRGPRWVGVAVVFGALVILVVLGVVFLSIQAVREVQYLERNQATLEDRGRAALATVDDRLAGWHIPVNLEQYLNQPPPQMKSWGQAVAHTALTSAEAVSRSLVEMGVVFLIAAYLLIYSQHLRDGFLRSVPASAKPYAEAWRADANRIVGGFVRGQMLLALVTGAAAAVGCLVLGIHLWLLVGLLVVIASLIPVFGVYVGAVPAVIAAAITPAGYISPMVRVILVIVLFVVLNEAGSKILYPRFVGKALGLHEVAVLFVLFAGLEVAGLVGVLFAAPITALALVTAIHLYRFWLGRPTVSLANAAAEGGKQAVQKGTP